MGAETGERIKKFNFTSEALNLHLFYQAFIFALPVFTVSLKNYVLNIFNIHFKMLEPLFLTFIHNIKYFIKITTLQ